MLKQENYQFSAAAEEMFTEYLVRRMSQGHFANARSVRNALDRSRLRQANRLVARGGKLSRRDLITIEPEDIRASRVFAETEPPESDND